MEQEGTTMQTEGEKPLEREIYENAIRRLETLGLKAVMNKKLIGKREVIKKSLLDYYESTEEYEKCSYVNDYFEKLENAVLVNVIDSLDNKEETSD